MGVPQENVKRMMRSQLSKTRGGNGRPHTTTGRTANSIRGKTPYFNSVNLIWEFEANDSAVRLNNGGSRFKRLTTDVPYSGKTGHGGESLYISALIQWCKRKYGLRGDAAKRMAFRVAEAASSRGRIIKNPGWFDEIEEKVYRQIISDIQSIMMIAINKEIDEQLKIR